MNVLRISRFVLLGCIIGLVTSSSADAKINPENQRLIKRFTEMTTVLRTDGLNSFLQRTKQQGWTSPKIFSAWYISRLSNDPDGFKQVEEAKSQLGLEFARQLSVIAKTVRETNDTAQLERASETLFMAVAWLGREVAYGNLFLQNRAYDIAAVAVIKLMADLSYPMEKAEAAMKRFDWGWGKPANCRKVLFEETKGQHFKSDKPNITFEEVNHEFRVGVSLVLKLGSINKRPDLEIFMREDLKPDESFIVPETTWEKRAHIQIGEAGFASMNYRNLAPLHEFRKRYGKFPTKPVKYVKHKSESDVKAAFWELSWENPYGVGGASDVYESYIDGRLTDAGYKSLHRSGTQRVDALRPPASEPGVGIKN